MADHNVEEKGVPTPTQHSANGSTEEKPEPAYQHEEDSTGLREAAERGHLATDKYVSSLLFSGTIADASRRYGRPIVRFDPKAEAKLLLKIDLYIVPTVSLLYLFCFIDRANIGMFSKNIWIINPT